MITKGYYNINNLKSLFTKSSFEVGNFVESKMIHSNGSYKRMIYIIQSKQNDDLYYIEPISMFDGKGWTYFNPKKISGILVDTEFLIKHFKNLSI